MRVRAVAVVFDHGELLVIAREKFGQRYLVLPGGGVEMGESTQEACLRELQEETGLEGEILGRLAVDSGTDHEAVYFAVAVQSRDVRLGGPEAERAGPNNRYEPRWVHPDDAAELVPSAARRAARAGERLARGHGRLGRILADPEISTRHALV